jgi:hypothetical protein
MRALLDAAEKGEDVLRIAAFRLNGPVTEEILTQRLIGIRLTMALGTTMENVSKTGRIEQIICLLTMRCTIARRLRRASER